MPDPLIEQIPLVKSLLAAHRIPIFEREGFEGEDVLATIAQRIVKEGVKVYIVTGDKDALQLVNSHICVYNPHKQNAILDADAVRARYGVSPDQMVDLMALMGDSIDNIPGVPGIGEKTAARLLQEFGTLDELYQGLDKIKQQTLRKNLEKSRKQVLMARELARIETNVTLDVSLEALKPQETDWRELRSLYRELDFKKLIKDLDEKDFIPMPVTPIAVHLLKTMHVKDSKSFFRRLSQDVTALGCWSLTNKQKSTQAILLAIAGDEGKAWLAVLDKVFLNSRVGNELVKWLSDPASPKLVHDSKATARLLRSFSIDLKVVTGDTMIVAHLLNPARTQQSLSDLSDEYLDAPLGKIPELQDDLWSIEKSGEPFARTVCSIKRLHDILLNKLKEQKINHLYSDLELPLMEVLNRMEATGIKIDVAYLNKLHVLLEAKLKKLTETIYKLAGESFNLNSPKQLSGVLFDKLKLPIIKRTKTGASTNSSVLHQLSGKHPLPKHLIEYREISKLTSTYINALPKLVNSKTKRIHTTFNQTATSTGRLSSSEPNLQNIPITASHALPSSPAIASRIA